QMRTDPMAIINAAKSQRKNAAWLFISQRESQHHQPRHAVYKPEFENALWRFRRWGRGGGGGRGGGWGRGPLGPWWRRWRRGSPLRLRRRRRCTMSRYHLLEPCASQLEMKVFRTSGIGADVG